MPVLPVAAPATPFVTPTAGFPLGVWGPDYYANVLLAEFVSFAPAGPAPPAWNAVLTLAANGYQNAAIAGTGAANFPDALAAELQELTDLIPYRPSVQVEALAQQNAMLPYFSGILTFNLRSHPATVFLCVAALRIGSFQAMFYKNMFNRARPSRLSPNIMTIGGDPPAHASYPSGHATQSRLIARVLEQVMPADIVPMNGLARDPTRGPLRMMADRIARNREVIGKHYPSDSAAGKLLGDRSFDILLRCPSLVGTAVPLGEVPVAIGGVNTFANGLLQQARREWAPR